MTAFPKSVLAARGERCAARVFIRDTYRRTGRGKSGFEMHYTERQCLRRAQKDGKCWQHQKPEQPDLPQHVRTAER